MDHHHSPSEGTAGPGGLNKTDGGSSSTGTAQPVNWILLTGIAAGTLAVCLASALLPCLCLRLASARSAAAEAKEVKEVKEVKEEDEAARRRRSESRRSRLVFATGCLTALGAGVILAMCFSGLMPAAAAAYLEVCLPGADGHGCRAAASLVPPAGCLTCCLLLWLARSLVDMIRKRRRDSSEEKTPLVPGNAAGASPAPIVTPTPGVGEGCCAEAATPEALQDSGTACLVTSALLLKAVVEGLALASMLRVASPLFVALGKCLHEAFCGLVVGLAWVEAGGTVGGDVSRLGIIALVSYGIAASGSILLGGLTASVQTRAGAGVQFGLLIAASGAALQATFLHILPRLSVKGATAPALVFLGMLVMTLVGALHHFIGGGHH